MNVFPADRIAWKDQHPAAFASDIARGDPLFGRIQTADGLCLGFILESPKTGNRTAWIIGETIMSPDGETVAGWKMIPTESTVLLYPQLMDRHIDIWND